MVPSGSVASGGKCFKHCPGRYEKETWDLILRTTFGLGQYQQLLTY